MAFGATALLDDFLFRQCQESLYLFRGCGIVAASRFLEGILQFLYPIGSGNGRLPCPSFCLWIFTKGRHRKTSNHTAITLDFPAIGFNLTLDPFELPFVPFYGLKKITTVVRASLFLQAWKNSFNARDDTIE